MLVKVDSVLLIYAFRYALGRKTYAVSDVARAIIEHKEVFLPRWREQIAEEIEQAIREGNAGMQCDIDEWQKVAQQLKGVGTD